ncbi:hypothetical protein ABN228_19560 [Providencia rettgeri]|uniref:hypothetical protein n=1 Tax=Providencia rettgeri TaxID=587 RepID=UPI0032DAE6F5
MTFSICKRIFTGALLILISMTQVTAQTQQRPVLQAILTINTQTPVNELGGATDLLEKTFDEKQDYLVAKMFYGYGQLFMATHYLSKKNYLKAAESSKLGFFYMDEAAETDENNWRMRYLRARMDSFVPASNGRCVIALKDTAYLQTNSEVTASLKPMILMMSARANTACQHSEVAEQEWASLAQLGEEGKRLSSLRDNPAPEWSENELNSVIMPATELTP